MRLHGYWWQVVVRYTLILIIVLLIRMQVLKIVVGLFEG
jgi:hypothetical protein